MWHITLLAIGVVGLALPAPVLAQAGMPRISVIATGGISVVEETGDTYGGELTLRLSRLFDITIGATQLSDITGDDVTLAASTIAKLVSATADSQSSANVIEAGVRVRLPIWPAVHPYALVGGGRARVTTETAFSKAGVETAPAALGISLGPQLNGKVSKGLAVIGAGVDVAAGRHVTIDAGVRYSGFVTERDESPRYHVFPVLRFQLGLGVRF